MFQKVPSLRAEVRIKLKHVVQDLKYSRTCEWELFLKLYFWIVRRELVHIVLGRSIGDETGVDLSLVTEDVQNLFELVVLTH